MLALTTIRRSLSRVLEAPSEPLVERPSRWESWLARADLVSPVRALRLPASTAIVGVGGATLGGSGRTPVAIALASSLAARGRRVTLIGHGYGARSLSRVHVVRPDSRVDDVGDEALVAARLLEGRARVVVGPTRAAAIEYAARTHGVLVVDRLLQTSPVRLSRALLVVDDRAPWGSGRVVPFGDLCAPRDALLDAADEVVRVGGAAATSTIVAVSRSRARAPLSDFAGARVGLVTSVARPRRVVDLLAEHGVVPRVHVERPDHGRADPREVRALAARARLEGLDGWLLDAKSAIHLELGSEAWTLDHRVSLSEAIVDRVASCTDDFSRAAG